MELTVALAWLTLLVAVPLNVLTTLRLRQKWRQSPHNQVLRERFVVSLITTLVLLFFAVIFINNDRTVPPISLEATKVITRLAMLGLGIIPAVGWLLIYRKRKP